MAIRIVSNQIADSAISSAKLGSNVVTPAKAALDQVWAFTALPTVSADPSSANDLVRKSYLDGLLEGLHWKKAARVRVASNVNLSSPGAALDGVTLSSGDRVLCVSQSTDTQNGLYVFNGSGSAMTRATDADPYTELNGAAVFILEGTSADSGFTQTATLTGFGSQSWVQFSGAGQVVAGNGLAKSGNTLSVNVDDSGIEINSDALRLKDAGVTAAKLATAVAGNGLAGGGGSALSVNVDDSSIEINSDSLRIKASGVGSSQIASQAVTEAKLSTSVAGNGLTGGNGSALAVSTGAGLAIDSDSVVVSLNGLSAAAVDVGSDSIAIIDATDNSTKKESIADLAAGMAGTGIAASSGSMNIDLNELSAAAVAVGSDSIAIIDATDNSTKKESIADLVSAMAGNALASSGGVLAVSVDDSTIEIDSDSLRVKDLGITAAKLSANSVETAKIADANVTLAKLENVADGKILIGSAGSRPVAQSVAGDLTLAANGNATIANNAISTAKIAAGAVSSAKIADDSVTLEKTGWLPYTESFNGTTATKYDLGRAVLSTHFDNVRVFRNGMRCKKTGSPADSSEYSVANDGTGSVCAISFGGGSGAVQNDSIIVDYFA